MGLAEGTQDKRDAGWGLTSVCCGQGQTDPDHSVSVYLLPTWVLVLKAAEKLMGVARRVPRNGWEKWGNKDGKLPFEEWGQILLHLVHSVAQEIADTKHVTGGMAESHWPWCQAVGTQCPPIHKTWGRKPQKGFGAQGAQKASKQQL